MNEPAEFNLCYTMPGSSRKLSPYFIPRILPNLSSGHVSMRFGLQGPSHCASTACASGAHAIGDAFNFVKTGAADIMLAGGGERNTLPTEILLQ